MQQIPEGKDLIEFLEQTDACLIRTPDALFYSYNPDQHVVELQLKPDELKIFDQAFHPADQIQLVTVAQLGKAINQFPIGKLHNKINEMISIKINNLCDQLKDTPDNKELLAAWIKMTKGQDLNRFVDISMKEKHFGDLGSQTFGGKIYIQVDEKKKKNQLDQPTNITIGLANSETAYQDWTIKNNQPTFVYSVNIYTVMGLDLDDYYYNDKDKCLHFLEPENRNKMKMNLNTCTPVMTINAEVSLSVEKD